MQVKITRDGHLKKVIKDIGVANKKKLEVGVFPESGELEKIARVHEFGCTIQVTPKMRAFLHREGLHLKASTGTIVIPERSFIRAGYRQNRKKFVRRSGEFIKQSLQNRVSLQPVIDRLGAELAGDLQEYAIDLKSPENHPFTIAKKKSSNPLIDTGRMVDQITYKVE